MSLSAADIHEEVQRLNGNAYMFSGGITLDPEREDRCYVTVSSQERLSAANLDVGALNMEMTTFSECILRPMMETLDRWLPDITISTHIKEQVKQ